MSGFPAALRDAGFKEHPERPCRHRKLSADMLALFQTEAQKHAELLDYDDLARRSGLSRGTVRGLMAQLIREKREGRERVRRGTNMSQSDGP